jgi:gliding motility-associated lipoprotein GldH
MKNFITLFVVGILLFSCTPEGEIYNEHKELSPEMEWKKKDARKFEVPIDDNSGAYDMSLSFRYAEGYPYKTAKVKVTEKSPSGKKTVSEYDLKVRKANGDYIGEGSLDIWDSEHMVEKGKKFEETGTYTYVIQHNMPQDPMPLAMEIGVIMRESK